MPMWRRYYILYFKDSRDLPLRSDKHFQQSRMVQYQPIKSIVFLYINNKHDEKGFRKLSHAQ
jgi:hypothetical protein